MNENNKKDLQKKTFWNLHFFNLKNGFFKIRKDKNTRLKFILFALLALLLVLMLAGQPVYFRVPLYVFWAVIYAAILLLGIHYFGTVPHAAQTYEHLLRIGLVNSAGEAPYLIRKKTLKNGIIVYTFFGAGFPLEKWEQYSVYIESALNITIFEIVETNPEDRRYISVWCVQGGGELSKLLLWNEEYLNPKSFVVALGRDAAGREITIDLSKIPHWLVGGATGTGKTKLVLLMCSQFLAKGAKLYVADWKGGQDYKKELRGDYEIVSDYSSLLSVLARFAEEMELRKQLFVQSDCSSIEEYNRKKPQNALPRWILVLDETSLILDTTGCDKEEKEQISKVVKGLTHIARLARAFGLHLIVATQRPEVASVPGSLKANLDGRLCAHMADAQSSMVILDDGSAAKLENIRGRFILRDERGEHIIFQAYFFGEGYVADDDSDCDEL